MSIRFIHTADIHLDSPLSGLSAYPDAPLDSLRCATRRAFEGLIDRALSEAVKFLVIAGDLFDGTWKDYSTGLFFIAQMGRLKQAHIRVVLLYGNHDAESDLARTQRLRLPENVQVFDSDRAHSITLEDLRVVLHGRSFWQRDVDENLVRSYPDPRPGWLNIGVLHTALSGREGHANYAPCSLEDLRAKGYQYWALGHVHEAELLSTDPYVAFSGSLQGRHIRETGAHGAFLVQAEDDRVQSCSRIETDVLRWHHLTLDVSSERTPSDVLSRIESQLGDALAQADGRSLAVRVTLFGETHLHGELSRQGEDLRLQAQALALGFGKSRLWIEKLRIATSLPDAPVASSVSGDPLVELQRVLEDAASDPQLLQELESELADLRLKLPPEVRLSDEPMLEHLRLNRFEDMIRHVCPTVLSWVREN